MKAFLQKLVGLFLHITGLEYLPVKARGGLCRGACWTLYPWTSYWRGNYEPAVAQTIMDLEDMTGKVCWDLGAHYGYYSVGLALRTGPTGQIAAFEPLPVSFARLKRHKDLNHLTWLKSFPFASSDSEGETEFIVTDGETVSHLPYDGEKSTQTTRAIRIRTVRLDDLVSRGEIRPADFIKVDVEGHGHRALAGAIETIRARLPTILMGFHSPQEVAGTEELLRPLGYEFILVGTFAPPDRIGADYLIRIPVNSPFQLQATHS